MDNLPRTFEPNDNATLVASFDDKQRMGADYRSELEALRREREIRSLMYQRHGVCG